MTYSKRSNIIEYLNLIWEVSPAGYTHSDSRAFEGIIES